MTFFIDPYKFGGGSESDPYYAYTGLILHFDEEIGTAQVANYSALNLDTLGLNNGATIQTSVYKFAPGSVAMAGPYSYVDCGTLSVFDMNEDWTWEFWHYPTAGAVTLHTLASHGAGGNGWQIFHDRFAAKIDGVDTTTLFGQPTLNTWHFLACVREGTELRFYRDGDLVATRTGVGVIQDMGATYPVIIGLTSPGDWPFLGYIDDTRFTKGVARYSGSTIPVPTAPFPNY